MDYDQQGSQAQQKKKRAYAQQAYEFGANTANPQGGAPPPMMGGVGAQQAMPGQVGQDQLANQFGQMNIQQQQQQPQQGYTQPLAQQQPVQQPVQQAPSMGFANQNQLLASDLMSQPFMVQELDNPPPPINLPPNVSWESFEISAYGII
jgi:protein transport protein SEC24